MQTFERTVLIIALIILILTLAIMGVALKNKDMSSGLAVSECPDFWFSSFYKPCAMTAHGCCTDGVKPANASGSNCDNLDCNDSPYGCCPDNYTTKSTASGANCAAPGTATCYNVQRLGKHPVGGKCLTIDPADFKTSSGKSELCNKQTFAEDCAVSWDGVSNIDKDC